MNRTNLSYWLFEQDILDQDTIAGQSAEAQPPAGGMPDISNMPSVADQESEPEDISQDPQSPEMPPEDEHKDKGEDFEVWKNNYFKQSIKGNVTELENLLKQIEGRDLDANQRKFVYDNLQVLLLRKDANIAKVSRDIRNNIKSSLDKNNPATSVVSHIVDVLETMPTLSHVFIRLSGMHGMKSDPHRKFIAALTGSCQIGSGSTNAQLIFNENDYSIQMTTRMNSQFGDFEVGPWALKEDDAAEGKFLSSSEIKRMKDGSPEEKDVLRKRLVVESLAEKYKQRAFIFNTVDDDGTIYHLGWDMSNFLKSGYKSGKLLVKLRKSDNSETLISDEGEIVPLIDVSILFVKNTDDIDEDGNFQGKEIQLMERRNGSIFLTASLDILKEAAASLQGLVVKSVPWRGNPSDIEKLRHAFPKMDEMLLRSP